MPSDAGRAPRPPPRKPTGSTASARTCSPGRHVPLEPARPRPSLHGAGPAVQPAARLPGALLPLRAARPLRDVQGGPVGPLRGAGPGRHPCRPGALRALQAVGPLGAPGAGAVQRQPAAHRGSGSRRPLVIGRVGVGRPGRRSSCSSCLLLGGGGESPGPGPARAPRRAGLAVTGSPAPTHHRHRGGHRSRPRRRPGRRSGAAAAGRRRRDRIEYEVQEGEALIAIAETFGIDRGDILGANQGMADQQAATRSPVTSSSCPSRADMTPADIEALPGLRPLRGVALGARHGRADPAAARPTARGLRPGRRGTRWSRSRRARPRDRVVPQRGQACPPLQVHAQEVARLLLEARRHPARGPRRWPTPWSRGWRATGAPTPPSAREERLRKGPSRAAQSTSSL